MYADNNSIQTGCFSILCFSHKLLRIGEKFVIVMKIMKTNGHLGWNMTFSAGFESKSVISFRYVFYSYHIVHRIAVLSFHFHADPPFVFAVFLSSVQTDCVSHWLLKLCFSHNCIGTKADAFRLRQRWMLQSYFCSRVKNHLHWIIRRKWLYKCLES